MFTRSELSSSQLRLLIFGVLFAAGALTVVGSHPVMAQSGCYNGYGQWVCGNVYGPGYGYPYYPYYGYGYYRPYCTYYSGSYYFTYPYNSYSYYSSYPNYNYPYNLYASYNLYPYYNSYTYYYSPYSPNWFQYGHYPYILYYQC